MSFSTQADVIALECKSNEPLSFPAPKEEGYKYLEIQIDREVRTSIIREYVVINENRNRYDKTSSFRLEIAPTEYRLVLGSSVRTVYSVNRQTLETVESIESSYAPKKIFNTFKCALAPQPENQI